MLFTMESSNIFQVDTPKVRSETFKNYGKQTHAFPDSLFHAASDRPSSFRDNRDFPPFLTIQIRLLKMEMNLPRSCVVRCLRQEELSVTFILISRSCESCERSVVCFGETNPNHIDEFAAPVCPSGYCLSFLHATIQQCSLCGHCSQHVQKEISTSSMPLTALIW